MFPEFKKLGTRLKPGEEMVNSMQSLPSWSFELRTTVERGLHRPFQHSMVRGKGQVSWDHRGAIPNQA